ATRLTKDFGGALALLAEGEDDALPRLNRSLRILVPINGTPAARNAAEIAFAIARPVGARVTALYVAPSRRSGDPARSRAQQEAVLKDIADLAERYGVSLRTALQSHAAADAAIVKRAQAGFGLVVMGVNRRPGDTLYF